MNMKRSLYISILLLCILPSVLCAQSRQKPKRQKDAGARVDTLEFPESYLDTVQIDGAFKINDYSMIGVHGGAAFSRMMFNPDYHQTTRFTPGNFGISYSKYGKLFGTYPYFGYQIGLFYTHEGYKFKPNEEDGFIQSIEGATEVRYDVVEVPFLSVFHYDYPNFKLLGCAGLYAGYRVGITRYGESVNPAYKNEFLPTDIRFDYGMEGGAGLGYVFAPFEFHIMGKVRWGWANAFEPDAYSKYYYRFASPLDIMVEAGIYFHISKRTGRSRAMLKQEAWDAVYNRQEEK